MSLTIAMLLLLLVGACAPVASASAASPIEGVWSFNGGKVAIHPGSDGTLVGTVVAPTKFAQCTHEVPEEMWTDMIQQGDEPYYWGLHQWFYENAECTPNPTLGRTAWRVMEAANGGHYLLVCFSSPEDPTQPTITPNGEHAGVSYGCDGSEVESGHVASLPSSEGSTTRAGVESFSEAVSLPSSKQCVSRRVFQIHLKDPKYDPIKEVVVTLGKRKLVVKRHGNVFATTIDLKGLPRGTFTVRLDVTTVLGHHLSSRRTYHTCATKPKSGKPKSLQPAGRGHR
ncbi:MAG: hypothetical protein ABSG93_18375 [Solirubrobacteraceae bacterium]